MLGGRQCGQLFSFRFVFIFNDFCQANYLNIYGRSSPSFGKTTTAIDDLSQVSFPILQRTLPWQPIFVGFNRLSCVL